MFPPAHAFVNTALHVCLLLRQVYALLTTALLVILTTGCIFVIVSVFVFVNVLTILKRFLTFPHISVVYIPLTDTADNCAFVDDVICDLCVFVLLAKI